MQASVTKDTRIRPLIWLLASACAQIIAFWYPRYVAGKYPSPDHDGRYFIMPEIIVGVGVVAILSASALVWRLAGHFWLGNVFVLIVGAVGATIALFPAIWMFVP
jgi:hypothetical protein